jgi:sigma-E factor negative regulatory protein RseB
MRAYIPEQRVVRIYKGPAVRPDFPALFVSNPAWVSDHYAIEKKPGKRVADLDTDLLVFVPRDQFRWRVHCWVEKRHGLPLKLQVLDPQGVILEEYAFSEIRINPTQAPQVAPSFEGAADWKQVHAPMAPKEISQSLAAGGPMIGFRPVASAVISEPAVKSLEQHVLSDGLAVVSVFVGPATDAEVAKPEVSRRGALSMVVRKKGSQTITAMGEVPAETVQDLVERFSTQ